MLQTRTCDVLRIKPARALGLVSAADWNNACNSFQTAKDSAQYGDQLWVRNGIYLPTKDTAGNLHSLTDRQLLTFSIKNGIKVYGDCAGTETNRED